MLRKMVVVVMEEKIEEYNKIERRSKTKNENYQENGETSNKF